MTWVQVEKYSPGPFFFSNFVFDMRTYNGIERPDFTPDMISGL